MENDSSKEVLIVGAGPVGLTLAGELARHGIRPRIIDRLSKPSPYCRAIGVTPRTLEVWEDMGIARDMIDAGIWLRGQRSIVNGHTHDVVHDLSDLPFSTLGIPQYATERLLAKHLASFGIQIERGVSLERMTQWDGHVQAVTIDATGNRQEAHFKYIIGCDGAHSAVRKALGIAFEGSGMPYEFMLGDVHIDWDVPRGWTFRAIRPVPDAVPEIFIAIPLPEMGRYRISMFAPPEVGGATTGTDHGIQSERPSPGLTSLQAVADALLPTKNDIKRSSLVVHFSHQHAARREVSGWQCVHRWRCRSHPPSNGRPGNEYGNPGRIQPGVEARAGS
jgi:2-polyprenyl-6-methoxyphenol hydroxylase-like FAD-dependent oxidoreductase